MSGGEAGQQAAGSQGAVDLAGSMGGHSPIQQPRHLPQFQTPVPVSWQQQQQQSQSQPQSQVQVHAEAQARAQQQQAKQHRFNLQAPPPSAPPIPSAGNSMAPWAAPCGSSPAPPAHQQWQKQQGGDGGGGGGGGEAGAASAASLGKAAVPNEGVEGNGGTSTTRSI